MTEENKFIFDGTEFFWKKETLKYYAESKKLLKRYGKYEEEETKEQRTELMKIEGIKELLKDIEIKDFMNEIIEKSRENKDPGVRLLDACYQLGKEIENCKEIFMLENLQEILEVCLEPVEEVKKINYISTDEDYTTGLINFGTEVFNFFLSKYNSSTIALKELLNTLADIKYPVNQT